MEPFCPLKKRSIFFLHNFLFLNKQFFQWPLANFDSDLISQNWANELYKSELFSDRMTIIVLCQANCGWLECLLGRQQCLTYLLLGLMISNFVFILNILRVFNTQIEEEGQNIETWYPEWVWYIDYFPNYFLFLIKCLQNSAAVAMV